jgi:hypothetical protein
MKIPGRKFAVVAVPVLVAAATLGVPLAGSAHALARQNTCTALRQEASDYYEESHLDFYDANQALEAGAWTDYLYYSYLEGKNNDMGDYVTGLANNKGC